MLETCRLTMKRLCRPSGLGIMGWALWVVTLSGLTMASEASSTLAPSNSLRLSGSVTTQAGEPLMGARVKLLPLQDNRASLVAWIAPRGEERATPETVIKGQTGVDGRFELDLPGASLWRLLVEAPGRVAMQQVLLPMVEDRHLAPVALELDEPLHVVCLDDAGSPLDDVLIFAFGPRPERRARDGWTVADRVVRTDPQGRAMLARQRGETLSLTARVAGTLTIQNRRVDPSSGGGVEWRFPKATGERVVQVLEPPGVSAAGAPAAGVPAAQVMVGLGDLAMPLAETDADGRVVLLGEPSEDVTWQLFAPDGRQLRHRADPSAAPISRLDTLYLPQRRPLQGRVVEAGTRRALAGVLVWPGNDPGRAVKTDTQGRFSFATYGTSAPWIQAEAAGYLPQLQRVQADGEGWVSPLLSLSPAAGLSGRVVDREGRPLPGVRLAVSASSPQDLPSAFRPDGVLQRAVSDADGRFHLAGLHPEASHDLRAELLGFATAVTQTSGVARRSDALQLTLDRARAAFGRVVDGDERPIAEARIVVADAAGDRALEPVLSDSEGRFQVTELPSKQLDLEVSKTGYPPVQVRAIEVPQGETAVDLGVILLRRGLALSGRVVDTEDRPVQGASLVPLPAPEDSQKSLANRQLTERPARSNADGHFRLDGLLPGQRIFLLVDHPDYVQQALEGVDVPSEALNVVLQKAVRVAGRVEDAAGQALAGATAQVTGVPRPAGTVGVLQDSDENDLETRTDDQGYFEVRGVIPGALSVKATLEGYQPADPIEIEVTLEEPMEDLVLVLRQGRGLGGTVQDGDGEPVEGAVLTLAHVRSVSDAEGAFLLAGLPEGHHDLEVRHPQYNWYQEKIEVGESSQTLEIVLRGGGAVAGQVLDEAGLPLPGAQVRLQKQVRRDHHTYLATSDADGRFQLESMALGPYQVEATRSGYASTRLPDILEVEGAVDGVEIVLRPGAEILGQVRGLDFEALSAVEVEADDGQGGLHPAVVDYEGNYLVADLGPGVWTVRGRLEGGRRQAEVRVALADGQRRVRRDLEFGGGLTLEGQVLLAGEPLPRTWVALRGASQEVERNVTSDYQGRFRFDDVQAGSYRLSLSNSRQMLVHNEDIELVQNRDLVLDLAAAEVRGRVTDGDGQGMHEALVRLQQMHGEAFDEPGSLITVSTDTAGRFHLARVSAGTYVLQVEKAGSSPWRQRLPITAGEAVGPLDIVLDATDGLRLDVRCAAGRLPAWVDLSLFDGAGQHVSSSRRATDEAGSARFESVPAGSWTVRVSGEGCAPGTRNLNVPGETEPVLLPGEARLHVQVAALAESPLRAHLTLRDGDGKPLGQAAGDGRWVTSWPLMGGQVQVRGLSAGRWNVEVVAADGQRWQGQLTLAEGGAASLTL